MKLISLITCLLLTSISYAQFEALFKEIESSANTVNSAFNSISKSAESWTQTASSDLTNYVTSSGESFDVFVKNVQNEMTKSAEVFASELNSTLQSLNEVSKLQCNDYTETARKAIANVPTPIDALPSDVENYAINQKEQEVYRQSVSNCKECISYATQSFICNIPKILEGNIALMRRLDDVMRNDPDIKNLDVTYKPVAAMVKMTYSDFSQAFIGTLNSLEKYRKALNVELNANSAKVMYGKEACQLYGTLAIMVVKSRLTAENPATTMEKTTTRVLKVLDKMDKVNKAGRLVSTALDASTTFNRNQVLSTEAQLVKALPPTPNTNVGTDLVWYGFDFKDRVVATNNGYMFIIKPNGYVYLYDHMVGRLPIWENGTRIETGWNIYDKVFAGTEKVIYGIEKNGDLYWKQNTNTRDAKAWRGRARIGTGWQGFTDVKAGNNGVIYARRPNGELLWYKNMKDGVESWHSKSGNVIGTGWREDVIKHWVVGQDGVIYVVKNDGNLYWYLNTSPGEMKWANNGEGLLIDTGWDKYVRVFGGKDNVIYGITAKGEIHRKRFSGKSPVDVPIYIESKLSSLVFGASNNGTTANTRIIQWDKANSNSQKYIFEKSYDGTVKIKHLASGLYLGFAQDEMKNGAKVVLLPNGKYHEYYFIPAEDGYYYLQVKHSGKYLCINHDSKERGKDIIQWDLTNPIGAQFKLHSR